MLPSLSHLAFLDEKSIGRRWLSDQGQNPFDADGNPFAVDIAKIRASKAWARLENNTVASIGFRSGTTDGVSYAEALARYVQDGAVALDLNVNLAEAIALQSNLGDIIFGHDGERFLSEKLDQPFKGRNFGVFVAEEIEASGRGLNLSYEVLQGSLYQVSLKDSREGKCYEIKGNSQEAVLVGFLDKIASVLECYQADGHLVSDTHKVRLQDVAAQLGSSHGARLQACFGALKEESLSQGCVSFRYSKEARDLLKLRELMLEKVYTFSHGSEFQQRWNILKTLYEFYYYFAYYREGTTRSLVFKEASPELYTKAAILALALMTEKQANFLSFLVKTEGTQVIFKRDSHRPDFPIAEFFPCISQGVYKNFWAPGINWARRNRLFFRLEAKKSLVA